MLNRSMIAFAIGSASLTSCSTVNNLPPDTLATASLIHSDGTSAGSAQLLAQGDVISLSTKVSGLPKGTHGFHLHTVGACQAPGFSSAGGHLNPTGKDHGKLSPGGPHLGDLPNLVVGNSGITSITIDLGASALGEDRTALLSSLFDDDGTAVVIHADPDDYMTNPSGNAGSRLVCGVLKPA